MTDDRVDALFRLPPGEFTAARDDLARQLRAAGDRESAKHLAGLRRPTVAAWAINQAVRTDPDAYGALREAGRQLQRAQRRALSGVGGAGLREAASVRREHVERLAEFAGRLLLDAGVDPVSHREAIVATFEAASASEEAGETVGGARLSRPLPAPSGFTDLAALTVIEPAPDETAEPVEEAAAPVEPGEETPDDGRAAERQAAAQAVSAARRRAKAAQAALRRARDAAEAARRDFEEADAEADHARREAADARGLADRARREAERAEQEAARAERKEDRLRRRAETERDRAGRLADDASEADRAARRQGQELSDAEERLQALEG